MTSSGQAQDTDEVRYQRLNTEALELLKSGKYEEAIQALEEAIDIDPEPAIPYYNIACGYSLNGETDEALNWLNKAIEHGFFDADHMEKDTDLDNIRRERKFRRLLRKARNMKKKIQDGVTKNGENSVYISKKFKKMSRKGKVPLLVVLHGYGGNAERFVDLWKPIADKHGALLCAPFAPIAVGTDQFAWWTRNEGGNEASAKHIISVIEKIKKEYPIDEKRIYLGGFSQGAVVAYQMAVLHPDRFRGAVVVAGNYRPVDTQHARRAGTRIVFSHGTRDQWFDNARDAARSLATEGMTIRFRDFVGGHSFPEDRNGFLKRTWAWLEGWNF